MRCQHHIGARLVEHRAPFGRRRLRAQADKRQRSRRNDRGTDTHGAVNENGRNRAGKNVFENNCHISTASVLNGAVRVKANTFFGSNATSKQGIEINGFIKAGSLVK